MTLANSWEHKIGQALSALRLDSIKNKILVLALLATLIPTVTTAVFSYAQNKRALTEKLNEELQSVGTQTAREMDLWIKERFFDARVFTGSFEVYDNLASIPQGGAGGRVARSRLNDYINAVHQRYTDSYAELLVLNPDGSVVTSSADSSLGVTIPDNWDASLRAGTAMLGEPYWDDAQQDIVAVLAEPINPPDGRYLGMLAMRLDFATVEALLQRFAPGSSGRAFLVTGEGVVVASSQMTASEGAAVTLDHAIRETLRASNDAPVEYDDGIDTAVLGTMEAIPGSDWAVVAEVPRDEAYAPVARLRNVTLLLVFSLLVIVGLIAYALGVFIVRPLDRLATGVGEVAAGDFSVDLPVSGGGEVGYLTQVFNNMVGQLRSGREALDQAAEELREQNRELERLSITDGLTQLTNRRWAMQEFENEIERARRLEHPFALLMLDVDHFKKFNDTYGHLEGDAVLQGVGTALKDATRGIDTPARYGGEEFMILLPECDQGGALEAARRIQSRLAQETFKGGKITMSVGVSAYPEHGTDTSALIAAADAALYRAKKRGRDRIVAAGDTAAPATSGKRKTAKKGATKRKATTKKQSPKK